MVNETIGQQIARNERREAFGRVTDICFALFVFPDPNRPNDLDATLKVEGKAILRSGLVIASYEHDVQTLGLDTFHSAFDERMKEIAESN